MNSIWIKSFTDGTQERGSDRDITVGAASWSQGRLTEIREVSITENLRMAVLQVENTEWHQFDKMIVPVTPGLHQPVRTHRVLQAKIQESHIGLKLQFATNGSLTICRLSNDENIKGIEISRDNVGSWVTLVLTSKEAPYVVLAERGQLKEKS